MAAVLREPRVLGDRGRALLQQLGLECVHGVAADVLHAEAGARSGGEQHDHADPLDDGIPGGEHVGHARGLDERPRHPQDQGEAEAYHDGSIWRYCKLGSRIGVVAKYPGWLLRLARGGMEGACGGFIYRCLSTLSN